MNRALQNLFGFELSEPGCLAAVAMIPVALIVGRVFQKNRSFRLGCIHLIPGDCASWRTRLHRLPLCLMVLSVVCLLIVLSRPERTEVSSPRRRGMDILLAIDLSSSMNEQDMAASKSRLAVAKEAAQGFIGRRAEDRIGLVTFARHADLAAPPTRDHDALLAVVDAVATEDASDGEDATAIGAAIAIAADTLAEEQGNSQIVVVLTDGEENVATPGAKREIAPIHAGQFCTALGVRVYTIAAGSGRRGADGEFTPLDTRALRSVAAATGGAFFEARDADGAADVYMAIDEFEQMAFEPPVAQRASIHAPFCLAALLLFVAATLLRWTVLRVLP